MAEIDARQLRDDLCREVGREAVDWSEGALETHAHDTWPLSLLRDHLGTRTGTPACVVSPTSVEQVAATLRYATRVGAPVTPFGAGSGVCGGVLPSATGIVIDMRRMSDLLEVDETSLTARVQAGKMGDRFEADLNERGYSMGHFPQSIALSTVGGWVATRAAGQLSTRYGSIEDMLLGLQVVLADGRVVDVKPTPRRSAGPDLRHLFLGAEGTLGVVTEVTVKIFPVPESRRLLSFSFADFDSGLEAIRQIVRAGWRPPVMRLYDAQETSRHFGQWAEADNCFLIIVTEGAPALTAVEADATLAICRELQGTPTGEDPVRHWWAERNHVPSLTDLVARGFVVDTIEVTADWGHIGELYREVIAAVGTVKDLIVVSGHSSHSYAQGTNIYFTFVAQPADPAVAESTYLECWERAMQATVRCGGAISHHHGIGRLRREWMRDEHGAGIEVMRAIKKALDPQGIMNPGVLLPDD
jgi:alkyldihydroxyacetonephosphate synthase